MRRFPDAGFVEDREYKKESSFDDTSVKMVVVTVSGCKKLNVRDEPSTDGKVLQVLDEGNVLEKVGSSELGEFSQVRLTTGDLGYAMTKYLKPF